MDKKRIVVIGGGAGGLELVRKLGTYFSAKDTEIMLVDKNRTHLWKPLLHEVAAGSLDANLDEVGYGGHGVKWGYRFFYGTFHSINRNKRLITIAPLKDQNGEEIIKAHDIYYDYLVIATGGVSNDFSIRGVSTNALFLEQRAHADEFRAKLLNECFKVSLQVDSGHKDAHVDVVIVGGGATGVELAAELYNAAKSLKNYGLEDFDESRLRVSLIEAGQRILPSLPEKLASTAKKELSLMGVTIHTSTVVSEVGKTQITTSDGRKINSSLTLWAAGVKGADYLSELDGLETDKLSRLVVDEFLQTSLDERISAIGDCASFIPKTADRPLHPRAQAAHQMAKAVFVNLCAKIEKKPLQEFIYKDNGSIVSLSRFFTIGSLMGNLIRGDMAIEGRLARVAYWSLYRLHLLAIHGLLRGLTLILIGHVNRIVRPKLKVH
ncbi:MAG: FAD-dependent oxidoreductase [Rhodospirillaceae bacterium TMED8]|nr:FAD-dependent oxidoreductase [Magnetovibrio sp.]OUT49929.1 MAG: FAD-dependent oxidoreductase [Rhodospirillaceae bacterium TMED8]|tara:strand:+ start:1133 stop:2440 length:1308 start_codon:yes stop_codon:yes gene_type:complete